MISDERLREAAQKVEESMLASLPDPEECKVPPPPEIERKIEKRIRRASHPIRHRVMKAGACFLLVVLVGGGSILTLSADARAVFVGWVQEVYETWFVYRHSGDFEETPLDITYRPTWLPDGYSETLVPELYGQVNVIYENDSGDKILFAYSNETSTLAGLLPENSTEPLKVIIGDCFADFYLEENEDKKDLLVWTNSTNNYIFWIHANLPQDDIVKIAESVVDVSSN